MFTRAFWKATTERAIASIAGGALSVMGVDAFGVIDADWVGIASVALGAGVVSVLKALAAGAKDGNPSIVNAEVAIPDGTGKRRAVVTSAGLDATTDPHNTTP